MILCFVTTGSLYYILSYEKEVNCQLTLLPVTPRVLEKYYQQLLKMKEWV